MQITELDWLAIVPSYSKIMYLNYLYWFIIGKYNFFLWEQVLLLNFFTDILKATLRVWVGKIKDVLHIDVLCLANTAFSLSKTKGEILSLES